MSYNKFIGVGNLTRDPELRVTPTGTSICVFALAINRKYTSNGTEREEVLFLDVEAWAKQGELVAKYLVKGSQCLVEGHLKMDTWDDKVTQQKRSKIKLVMSNVQFLGAPRMKGDITPAPGGPAAHAPERKAPTPQQEIDEDVPFN